MRTTLICLALLFVGLAGYGYHHNPAGCAKLGSDLVAIFTTTGSAQAETPAESAQATAPSDNPTPAVPASAPTPSPAAPSTVATPPPQPIKTWAPPDVMPAQPNWTWTTADGKTYENVVVTSIDIDNVTINHSLGVAHLDNSTLPPDIQKQLNYDPVLVAAAKAEKKREIEHPYYPFASLADAQQVARRLHWPLAWLDSHLPSLSVPDPQTDTEAALTQMAVNELKPHSIIIFLDGNADLGSIPKPVLDQFFTFDDGPMPGGHHFYGPKVVFSNPDGTKALGRVSSTQMKASGTAAIDSALSSAAVNADADSAVSAPPAAAPAP